jgi:hypothetical protein
LQTIKHALEVIKFDYLHLFLDRDLVIKVEKKVYRVVARFSRHDLSCESSFGGGNKV